MTTEPCSTQLLVLGAGPGGYAAAFRAADLGLDVTLVDPEPAPGGTCLHRGCIPSKALLHVAALIEDTKRARAFGVDFGEPTILAIGDLCGEPMLAHKATHEGLVAAEVAAGRQAAFEPQAIPAVVFTDPEIAWCGMSEDEAKAAGIETKSARRFRKH